MANQIIPPCPCCNKPVLYDGDSVNCFTCFYRVNNAQEHEELCGALTYTKMRAEAMDAEARRALGIHQ